MSTEMEEFKTIPHFDGSLLNWPIFCARIELYLRSKSLFHVIEKEIDISLLSDTAKDKILLEDVKARSIIVNKLNTDAFNLVCSEKSAFDMLKKLKAHYQSESAASVLGKFDKLLDLQFDNTKSIISHVAEINSQISQLKESGKFDWEKLHIIILLRSMPKNNDWSTVVTSLKVQEKDLSKEKIIRILQDTEFDLKAKSKGGSMEKKNSIAFNTNNSKFKYKSKNVECHRCGKMGHIQKDCRVNPNNFVKKSANRSSEKNYNQTKINEKEFSYAINHLKEDQKDIWIKDSGASNHYCNNKEILHQYKEYKENRKVEVASGISYNIIGEGKILVNSFLPKNENRLVEIKNVYYVPEFSTNLISTISLQSKGLSEVINGTDTIFFR